MNPPALRWLAAFAVAYGLLHHQGFVLARLGEFGDTGTRWADWIDLATPYLLLGPAAGVLVALRTGIRPWLVFAVGAVAYVEGHGIHLAANSIDNAISEVPAGAGPIPVVVADVVHFWDEMVGHYIWYGGLTLIVVAMVGAAWSVCLGGEYGAHGSGRCSGLRRLGGLGSSRQSGPQLDSGADVVGLRSGGSDAGRLRTDPSRIPVSNRHRLEPSGLIPAPTLARAIASFRAQPGAYSVVKLRVWGGVLVFDRALPGKTVRRRGRASICCPDRRGSARWPGWFPHPWSGVGCGRPVTSGTAHHSPGFCICLVL